MWFVYLVAGLSICVGLFLVIVNNKITWKEFSIGSLCALLLGGMCHGIAHYGMVSDVEMWSATLDKAVHYPYWYAEWTTTSTDSNGNTTIETHSEHHYEHWTAYYSVGSGKHYTEGEFEISESKYNEILSNFSDGKITTERPYKPDFDHGDRNIYVAYQKTGYVYPVTITKYFSNKLKASPSLFNFDAVPDDVPLYDWPESNNTFSSDRLLGRADGLFDIREFDLMNSRLGPTKKVNVIFVGFAESEPQAYGQYLQSKWIGGKKNDLVVCFGGGTNEQPAKWSYVFGWTDEELVKKNLQTMFLTNPLNNDLLSPVEKEIRANYEIKEWRDFDYLEVPVPSWIYWLYPVLLIGTQVGLYYYFHVNDDRKFGSFRHKSFGSSSLFKSKYLYGYKHSRNKKPSWRS